ncbi:MAG: hypothetical protein MZV63_23565 [Marinilabiliales bacterium]|nr:hypothetical protein [Marinilabiliales bacterium]
MHVYHLVVDGVQMADPNNMVAGFTAMPPYSQLVGARRRPGLLRRPQRPARHGRRATSITPM